MDHATFSALAHARHVYCNPVSAAKMDAVVRALELPPGARVVDAGCGKGELLLRIAESYGAACTGFDVSRPFLAAGRERLRARGLEARVELVERDADEFEAGSGTLDLAMAIGASHLYGGLARTLEKLSSWVKPGGLLLAGEGYWRQPPSPGYLALLGAEADDFLDHSGNVRLGMRHGLTPLAAWTSSEDEWCDYEWLYVRTAERWAEVNPDHPDRDEALVRAHRIRDAHLGGGLETLGFGLYLLRKG